MSAFQRYSEYYDLLYRDKDYAGETEFIVRHLRKFAPEAVSLLELGCGTGLHAQHLAAAGYRVHGIDLSADMLAAAAGRVAGLAPELAARLEFAPGDVRDYRAGRTFDAVLSLFHVLSYQTTAADLLAALTTAAEHLEPGGVFLCDYWFGPAVLAQRPETRIKRMDSEAIAVTRIAEPVLHPAECICDVNYNVFVRDKADGAIHEFSETHRMRYLFLTELELLAEAAGLRLVESFEWMTGRPPSDDTWGLCSVFVK